MDSNPIIMHKFWSKTKFGNLLTLFKYEPEKYWKARGKVYYNEKISTYDRPEWRNYESKFLNYIKKLEFETVLEFGCGYGRITNLMLENFPQIKEYKAIDLSPDQIHNAKKIVKSEKVDFEVTTIQKFKPKKKYDLVIGFDVLMHVPPNDINSIIEKLVNLTQKHIVNQDWDDKEKPKINLAKHCFLHNYEKIYQENASIKNVNRFTTIEKPQHGSIFHAEVKE